MRLIDADKLKNAIPEVEPEFYENCGDCKMLSKSDVEDFIDEQPTAYDVDAVIDKINKMIDDTYEPREHICSYKNGIAYGLGLALGQVEMGYR